MINVAPQRVIDSHLHIWELGVSNYGWITPELGFLYRDFPAASARQQLDAAGVQDAILVQVEDSLLDTNYMLSAAEQNAWILGVVGWLPLDNPELVAAHLGEGVQHEKLVGLRHLIHDDPRNGFLALNSVRQSLKLVAQAGLAFDIPNAWPKSMGEISNLATRVPDLKILIDHLGKPPLLESDRKGWEHHFKSSSNHSNVSVKLSGLLQSVRHYSEKSLEPLFDLALESFGAHRILFGGDWPVSSISGNYKGTVDVLFGLISKLSADERDLILWKNASSIYGVSSNFSDPTFEK
jgi:L-fuconolactonase